MRRSCAKRLTALLVFCAISVLLLPACGVREGNEYQSSGDKLVLAGAQELGNFNPVNGYGELGVSPIFDGLLRLKNEGPEKLPTFEPALASDMPNPNTDFTQWSVNIRSGIKFHDGSLLDATDVAKTYKAILDPNSASEIASSFAMIRDVTASSDSQVTFQLFYGYRDFPTRMLVGVAPSEKLTGGPVKNSDLNRRPIGTGPFRLTQLTAERAVLSSNEAYWRGAPQIKQITYVYLSDDNARAQRMKTRDFDGTILPPQLAATFANKNDYRVASAKTADWRGVALPANSLFAKDPVARKAMNLGANRDAMLEKILGGSGRVASTPVSPVYGDAWEAKSEFPYDPTRANSMLDQAGWVLGADGVRRKGSERAQFTVAYRPSDILRRDLATAFASDMKVIGVDVNLEALPFDKIASRIESLGILLGGGDRPYSLDTQLYGALHTKTPGSSTWDNPGNFGTPYRDALLEEGRKTSDITRQTEIYRRVQESYIDDPSYVFLVFVDHTYVMKARGTEASSLTVEPHEHGVTWGPWWDLSSWKK